MKYLSILNGIKILLLLLLIFQLFKINTQYLGADAGAILPASRDVVKYGKIPYTDLYTIYTPLSYYVYGVCYLFYEVPSMKVIMYFNFFMILVSAFIFRKTITPGPYRDPVLLLYLLSVTPLLFDVKIETLGLPFLAVLAFRSSKILTGSSATQSQYALYWSSLIIALLFLFKQYYLVLFPMVYILFLIRATKGSFQVKESIRAFVLSSIILTAATCTGFLVILRFDLTNFNFDSFILQLSGKYLFSDCASYSTQSNPITALYNYLRYTILLYPFLFGTWCLIFFSNEGKRTLLWSAFLLIPIVLFSFNVNPHYLFIVAPYIFILFALLGSKEDFTQAYFNLNPKRIRFILITLSLSCSFYIIRNHFYGDVLYITHYEKIKTSYQRSEEDLLEIRREIGQNKKVYLGDGLNKMFVYRLDLESINSSEIGYIFLYNSCLDKAFVHYAPKDAKLLKNSDLSPHPPHD